LTFDGGSPARSLRVNVEVVMRREVVKRRRGAQTLFGSQSQMIRGTGVVKFYI